MFNTSLLRDNNGSSQLDFFLLRNNNRSSQLDLFISVNYPGSSLYERVCSIVFLLPLSVLCFR